MGINYVLPSLQPIDRCTRKVQQGVLAEGLEPGDGLWVETDRNAPGSTD